MYFFFFCLAVTKTEADNPLNNFQSSCNITASFGRRSLDCLSTEMVELSLELVRSRWHLVLCLNHETLTFSSMQNRQDLYCRGLIEQTPTK